MPARAHAGRLGEAFEELYTRNFAYVWRMLIHFGVPRSQVEDAVQDVFVVVHRRLGDWDRRGSERGWLAGIARRVAAGRRRTQARHQRKLEALPRPTASPAIDGRVADRQLLATLERALAELPEGARDAFVMTELEGMTAREIAEATGVNPNTVAARLRKARAALARVFAAAHEAHDRERRHG